MRTRKNINCLSAEELHDLREAFAGLYQLPDSHPNSFATIAGLHGNPPPSYCIHSNNGFLSWHRAYLLEMENALRTIRCDVTLPYWNWSSGDTVGVPEACSSPTYVNRNGNTVANPLYSGPKPNSLGGGQTTRRSDIDSTPFGDLASQVQSAMTNTVWLDFVSDIDNVHGGVHIRIGGDMSTVSGAGFDPIFYFHHCNIDRLWASWQIQHPITLPSSEANAILEPFTKPYSNSWHRGADFEHTLDWDYKYQYWCFIIPPVNWPFEKYLKLPIDDYLFKSKRIALSASSPVMPKHSFEIKVFINDLEATAKSKTHENSGFAGSINVFGMGDAQMSMLKRQEFKATLDITSILRKHTKKSDKEFTIKLASVFPEKQEIVENEMDKLKIEIEVL